MCLLWALIAVDTVSAQAPGDPGLQKLLAVWKARQTAVTRVRFALTERQFFTKGSLPSASGPKGPPEDATVEMKAAVLFDFPGNQMRVSEEGNYWSMEKNDFVFEKRLLVFDGKVVKEYKPQTHQAYPRGYIATEDPELTRPAYAPIRITYAPSRGAKNPLDIAKCWLSARQGVVDGRACLLLEETPNIEWWVDPARDYTVVRRFSKGRDGQVRSWWECSYVQDAAHGWVPSTWKYASNNKDGSLQRATEYSVTAYAINPPAGEDDFQLDFPVGTFVEDLRDKKGFIVRPDDGQRVVTMAERMRRVSYDELVKTESGAAGLPPARSAWAGMRWISLGICVVSAVLLLFRWLRRLRPSKR
jgi:hypothetical protein